MTGNILLTGSMAGERAIGRAVNKMLVLEK